MTVLSVIGSTFNSSNGDQTTSQSCDGLQSSSEEKPDIQQCDVTEPCVTGVENSHEATVSLPVIPKV